METSTVLLDDIMDVNFKSIYNLSRLCVPHLIKTQGMLINVRDYRWGNQKGHSRETGNTVYTR